MQSSTNIQPKGSSSKDSFDGSTVGDRKWDAMNYIRGLDSFAKDIPAFNIKG